MHTRRSLPRLSQFLFTLFFLCVLVGMFSLISLKPAHAATAMPYPEIIHPDCASKQDVQLSGGRLTFRTHVSCNLQVTSLNSEAIALDLAESPPTLNPDFYSLVQSSCNNCRDLFNPSVGKIAIHVGSGGESRAHDYVVQEHISWTYVDRGGTHTQTKNFTISAASSPRAAEAATILTPAQYRLLNDVKSRLGKTPYHEADIAALIVHAGYNNPDAIAFIIRGGRDTIAVYDNPSTAKMMNALSSAELRDIIKQAIDHGDNGVSISKPDPGHYDGLYGNLLQKNFEHLRNTGNFRPHALDHIFKGEINASGQATGFHYTKLPRVNGAVDPRSITFFDRYGVFRAKVTVNGVQKMSNGGYSTFFPLSMTPQDVVDSINEAYNNKVRVPGKMNLWEGHASSGMPIRMALDGTGKIITAYPVVTPP